ncbi:MAG: mechanosensitive ion channel family protein [Pikeienuella sp.]
MSFIRLFKIACLIVCLGVSISPLKAQMLLGGSDSSGEAVELPENLTPEIVDGLLARLTDAEVREVLQTELLRQSDAQAAAQMDAATALTLAAEEVEATLIRAQDRFVRWSSSLANIGNRQDKVAKRLERAEQGVLGMILAALTLIFAGAASWVIVRRLTRQWRRRLRATETEGAYSGLKFSYWEGLLRTLALGLVELLPIFGFWLATRAAAPILTGPLGPLNDEVWIYRSGVVAPMIFILLIRRGFAPDAPHLRIASLSDQAAKGIFAVLHRAAVISGTGWVLAGLFQSLGFGFPPSLLTVAATATAVWLLLTTAVIRNAAAVHAAALGLLGGGGTARLLAIASPALLCAYIFAGWAFWAAMWFGGANPGRHHLDGPLGTLFIFLLIPIFDRLGKELINGSLRGESEAAERFRRVFLGAWRAGTGFGSMILIGRNWGFKTVEFAKGENAPLWADAAFDIGITFLIGALIWRLIGAALHYEKRVSDASEDVDPSSMPAASRFDTLTPLFRNVLFAFLGAVMLMIALSAVGVDIGPLIASAGIIGIAVGFGAQALVRDVLAGVFFLIDDAFRVGEYIELDNDMRGEVENITIRSLQLRHHRGPIITLPFGELRQITNHNRDWVIYKMMFRLEPETDPQKVKKVVKKVGAEFMEHPDHGPKFIEPLKSQGVYFIDDDSALMIRVKFKCKPRAQFVLRREIYHRLRAVFAEQEIKFARRKIEVVGADGEPVKDPKLAAAAEDVIAVQPGMQAGGPPQGGQ